MHNGRSALPGPWARRAPSSGRSAGGGGTSSGPQHAQHSVRWPCWGSLRGPRWAWTTSGGRGVQGSPGGPTCLQGGALLGWAAEARGRDISLKRGVRASCFTPRLVMRHSPGAAQALLGGGSAWTGSEFYRRSLSCPDRPFFLQSVMDSPPWPEKNKWEPQRWETGTALGPILGSRRD